MWVRVGVIVCVWVGGDGVGGRGDVGWVGVGIQSEDE